MTQGLFTIINSGFNRENYPTMIGQQFDTPPAYAAVVSERQQLERKSDEELRAYQKVLLISVPEAMRAMNRRHRRIVGELLAQRRIQRAAA